MRTVYRADYYSNNCFIAVFYIHLYSAFKQKKTCTQTNNKKNEKETQQNV